MTVAVWPSELPPPERQSFQMTSMEARLKRQSEAGPPAYRRRFSSIPKPITMSIVVARDLKGVFDTFYEETTSAGSLPFYMPDPTSDGWPMLTEHSLPMLTSDGVPILVAAQWLCLFGESIPAATAIGMKFRISFNVTVMP